MSPSDKDAFVLRTSRRKCTASITIPTDSGKKLSTLRRSLSITGEERRLTRPSASPRACAIREDVTYSFRKDRLIVAVILTCPGAAGRGLHPAVRTRKDSVQGDTQRSLLYHPELFPALLEACQGRQERLDEETISISSRSRGIREADESTVIRYDSRTSSQDAPREINASSKSPRGCTSSSTRCSWNGEPLFGDSVALFNARARPQRSEREVPPARGGI